jgi:hypothetical protein
LASLLLPFFFCSLLGTTPGLSPRLKLGLPMDLQTHTTHTSTAAIIMQGQAQGWCGRSRMAFPAGLQHPQGLPNWAQGLLPDRLTLAWQHGACMKHTSAAKVFCTLLEIWFL